MDATALRQVELLRHHPLILAPVTIHADVYEVESGRLRLPDQRLSDRVNTREGMARG
ncbi:MAG: hypothetical protein OWV35_10445 [Firmicutes bacterium]|nr:hypothetical protein [Bacillota bacterium]